MTPNELQARLLNFAQDYFLTDLRNDKEYYYALTPKDFAENRYLICGYVLNLIMDGNLDKANEIIDSLPEDDILRIGLSVVNPSINWKQFVKYINRAKEMNKPIKMLVLTAGRPFLLNGFNDFTRLGPLLIKYKENCIENIEFLYGSKEKAINIYNLSIAEYYYQQNRLIDAELLVSRTIKEFDNKKEERMLFTALYLQSRILLANGTLNKSESYVKEIKKRINHLGVAEFSSNINAVEVVAAFYDGRYEVITNWMNVDAPDEIEDFNMLDLYRYMVKIRCYIVLEKYNLAISLIEKLRELLIIGTRRMDLCEVDLLLAMTLYAGGKKDSAFEALERALKIARRRGYFRLIADEGIAMFNLLLDYVNEKGETPYLHELIEETRKMAILYPLYLKPRYKNNEQFSNMEIDILRLLQQGKSQEEIGEYFFISVNTVKYHLKKIYFKLGAKSANQAVWNATLLGLIR